jgi:hypothetical protein
MPYASTGRRYVIVGGGNAAGYAARTFVEHGMADGRLCIVSKEVLVLIIHHLTNYTTQLHKWISN